MAFMPQVPAAVRQLCVLGCGTMGKAILSGLIESGLVAQSDMVVRACVTSEESAAALLSEYGSTVQVLVGQNVSAVRDSQAVILCVKPQVTQSVLQDDGMADAIGGKLVISLLAGVRLEQLEEWLPRGTPVIRSMPNTPCRIREGMTILSCRPSGISADHKAFAKTIFATLGRCRYLDEKHMDAVTALSGSGPAFACVMLESLADGGVMMGLPRQVAVELAAQALQGAARLVLQSGEHPSVIKDMVTTPGGCTIAGLLTMEDGKIRSTLARTIQEASNVASTLGSKQDKSK